VKTVQLILSLSIVGLEALGRVVVAAASPALDARDEGPR